MTRLFVAAWPPPDVAALLRELTADEPAERERRVAEANWHVTLRFVGDAEPAAVVDALRAAHLPAAHVTLGPEVIDLDGRQIVVPATGVDRLAVAVRDATGEIGERDGRPFFGHLTLARVRHGATSTLLGRPVEASFGVERVAVVASELRAEGPIYTTLAEIETA